jgi:toxin ParE1/3/4
MHYEVLLTEDAYADLAEIHAYVSEHNSLKKADDLLDNIAQVIESLSTFPDRGFYPEELVALGIRDYRQRFFKPYRIIYRVIDKRVYIYLIADSRRDFQSLLARRLLRA